MKTKIVKIKLLVPAIITLCSLAAVGNAQTVYYSDGEHRMSGFKSESGLYLQIYKENKWVPDVHNSQMISYVCRTCGYFEMFVRDLEVLEKLDDCDNWKKIEPKKAFTD